MGGAPPQRTENGEQSAPAGRRIARRETMHAQEIQEIQEMQERAASATDEAFVPRFLFS